MGFIIDLIVTAILDFFLLSLPNRVQIGCLTVMALALAALIYFTWTAG